MTILLFCENKSKVYDDSIFHLYKSSKYPQWKTFLEHSFQFAFSIKWLLRKACNEKNWHGVFISFYWPLLSLLPTRAERNLRFQPTSLLQDAGAHHQRHQTQEGMFSPCKARELLLLPSALADSLQGWLWTPINSSQKEIMRKAVHWTQKDHILYWDNWGAKIWGCHWNLHLTHLKCHKYQLARVCPARVWCVGFPLRASHLPTGLSLQIALLPIRGDMILIGNLTSEISVSNTKSVTESRKNKKKISTDPLKQTPSLSSFKVFEQRNHLPLGKIFLYWVKSSAGEALLMMQA